MPDSTPSAAADAPSSAAVPTLPFTLLAKALGEPLRWAILRELASGERLMVIEIAARTGKSSDLVSKHLAVLRKVGLAEKKQRLYSMPPEFIDNPERRELDLGYCVLRLDTLPD
ncbi:MAG: ArsR/SmtB family transcription factor [Verrucomicrobiales bacterium]